MVVFTYPWFRVYVLDDGAMFLLVANRVVRLRSRCNISFVICFAGKDRLLTSVF